MIHCVKTSYSIDNIFITYLFLKGNSSLKRNYSGIFDVSYVVFSNVISLVLRDSDMGSKNISLIRRSVLDGQKTCSSKGVSLIGI